MKPNYPKHIIFFDGVCNLCNSSINFIIKKDKENIFSFAALQWPISKEILKEKYPENSNFKSILYYEDGEIHTLSTAVLKILKKLPFPYSFLYGYITIPKFIRDRIYKIISKNRYYCFGKKNSCMIPKKEIIDKFLH
jgi:predicted DCC family thiol-disulfide oxidoreductase YuxK